MNERQFRRTVQVVIGIYAAAFVIGVLLKIHFPLPNSAWYDGFKDLIPLVIAIPAAWLGYSFQRRQAYLKDVRDLWSMLVLTVQEAIQYTHLEKPDVMAFAAINKRLSITIEEIRAVFSSLGANQFSAGLYPFESIKTIQLTISKLGFGENFSGSQSAQARREIVELWKKLRLHFLTELERGLPTRPDSPYLQ